MSWDSYISSLIDQSKNSSGDAQIDCACIIAVDSGQKLTSDDNTKAFKITNDEAVNIAKCFRSKNFSRFVACGVRAEGLKYTYIRLREENDRLVLGKSRGEGSVTLQSSKTAVVVAHTKEGGDRILTNKAVANVVEKMEFEGK